MKSYLIRLRLLFPKLLYALVFVLITTILLRWLLDFKFDILDLKDTYWVVGLSSIVAIIGALVFVRPAGKLLLNRKGEDDTTNIWLFAGIILWLFGWFGQYNLIAYLNKLEKIESVSEIRKIDSTKYFEVDSFQLSSTVATCFTSLNVSGKHNGDYNIDVYFVFPIEEKLTLDSGRIWYGMKFHKRISNHKSDEFKDNCYEAFVKECRDSLSRFDFNSVTYFERIPTSEDLRVYNRAIELVMDRKPIESDILLVANYDRFSDSSKHFLRKLVWMTLGYLVFFMVMLAFYKLDARLYKKYITNGTIKHDSAFEILYILVPQEGSFVLPIILNLNLLMFFVLVFYDQDFMSFSSDSLLSFGGNMSSKIDQGEYWRLISSTFLHSGFLHLLFNGIALVITGAFFIELIFGKLRLAIIYILCGLGGSLASYYWYDDVLSVGASGAIFGLFGIMLFLTAVKFFEEDYSKVIFRSLGVYALIGIVYGIMTPGTDNAAHIGGFITGIILGVIFYFEQGSKPREI